MGLGQSQEVSPEQRLEQLEELVQEIRADIDLCMNYVQAIAQQLLGAEKLAELHARVQKRNEDRKNARGM